MSRHLFILGFALTTSTSVTHEAIAQQLPASRFAAARGADTAAMIAPQLAEPPPVRRFVIVGAIAGGLIAGFVEYERAKDSEGFVGPIVPAAAMAFAGAFVGAWV